MPLVPEGGTVCNILLSVIITGNVRLLRLLAGWCRMVGKDFRKDFFTGIFQDYVTTCMPDTFCLISQLIVFANRSPATWHRILLLSPVQAHTAAGSWCLRSSARVIRQSCVCRTGTKTRAEGM